MLIKLLPEQISKFWDVVKYAIEESLPPIASDHPDKMNRILSSALSDEIGVWVSYTHGDNTKIDAVILTKVNYDDASGSKSMLIYCLYGFRKVSEEIWHSWFDAVRKYAISRGCSRVVAYTDVPKVIEMAKSLGGNVDYTFITFDLED